MIAKFLRDLIDYQAVNMRNNLPRKDYEYFYVLCNSLLIAGYTESDGKVVKPGNQWKRRVR